MEYPNKIIEEWEKSSWKERDNCFEYLCSKYLDYILLRSNECLVKKVIKKECKGEGGNCKCGSNSSE